MRRLAGFLAVLSVIAFAAGCSETTDNANLSNTNNSNHAVLTNNNRAANTATVATTNSNSNSNTSIIPTREEYEKSKAKFESEAKSAGSKVGSGLEDGWIWTKVKYELAAADDLRDSTISVDVENNAVTLRGNVATPAQKTKAVAAAKAVAGVKSVKDELKISATGNTNANTSSKKAAK